ncbi:hypothetical protein Tco_0405799 [Tanacetum coccineum]
MKTANQGMSVKEIEQIVAQRVANVIETIAIYKTKTRMAQESISQTKQQEKKVAGNASNKRKWEGNHNGGSSQQNKEHKVLRAQTTKPRGTRSLWSLLAINGNQGHYRGFVQKYKESKPWKQAGETEGTGIDVCFRRREIDQDQQHEVVSKRKEQNLSRLAYELQAGTYLRIYFSIGILSLYVPNKFQVIYQINVL